MVKLEAGYHARAGGAWQTGRAGFEVGGFMRVWVPAVIVLAIAMQSSSKPLLALVHTIELPGVEGRIDHLAFDAAGGRLFIAALGHNTVEVIDVKKAVHLKSLTGFREPQGIAIATDAGVVAVANGQGEGDEGGRLNAGVRQHGRHIDHCDGTPAAKSSRNREDPVRFE
jgi:hypothetical protein